MKNINHNFIFIQIILILILIQGCSVPQRKANVLKVDPAGVTAISYPTELRGAYFIKKGSDIRVCAEPTPDVSLESLQKLTANLKVNSSATKNVDSKIAAELNTKVIQLAGRTELLLLARELLYRACEISLNTEISDESVLTIYSRVADLVSDLGKGDRASAEADLLREKNALKSGGALFDNKKEPKQ